MEIVLSIWIVGLSIALYMLASSVYKMNKKVEDHLDVLNKMLVSSKKDNETLDNVVKELLENHTRLQERITELESKLGIVFTICMDYAQTRNMEQAEFEKKLDEYEARERERDLRVVTVTKPHRKIR